MIGLKKMFFMLKKIYPAYVSKDNTNREKQIKEEIIKNVSYLLIAQDL